MHILPRPHLLTDLQNHAFSIEQHEQTHESASTLTDSYWKLFVVHRQLHLFWNPTLCEEHNRYVGHHFTRPPWRWPDLQQQTGSNRCTDRDQQHTSIGTDRRRTTLAGHQSCPSTFPQTNRPGTKLNADAFTVDLSFCDDRASPPNLSSASATSDNSVCMQILLIHHGFDTNLPSFCVHHVPSFDSYTPIAHTGLRLLQVSILL